VSTPDVIKDVSESLKSVLEDGLADAGITNVNVTINTPKLATPDATNHVLNLYLYHVSENPNAKNRPPLRPGPDALVDPPLALNLHYMVTPHAAITATNTDEHLILGHGMRVLHDAAILRGPVLSGSLQHEDAQLSVVLIRMNLEEQTRIWNALQEPYRLSVCYEVRIVLVDSRISREVDRVRTQITEYSRL
jgi:hypothetical protein